MKSGILSIILILGLSLSLEGQKFDPDFFCFEDAFLLTPNYSFEDQASLLKRLGFEGIELEGLDRAGEKLEVLKRAGLPVYMVYIQIDLEKELPYDTRLLDFIKQVSGSEVTLWLHIHSDKLKPSDQEGDKICVPIIQKLADFALQYGVNLALYPHTNFWLEKIDDSVRLTGKINRRNVGAVFNLCHFLKTDNRALLEQKLIAAIPFLSVVSVNGADDGNTNSMDWKRLIQPLGEGTFDVLNVLRILKENSYKGPVGLQCYNISGEPSEFLAKSMKTWNNYINEISNK